MTSELAELFPPRAVSGIEPRERLRVGTYLTIIYDQIRLQHEYPGDTFFVVADYHALTQMEGQRGLGDQAREMARAYLLLGVDPNKAVIYRQSDVPELFELLWILACFSAPLMPSTGGNLFRDLAVATSIGHAIYPLLMAADTLGLRGTTASGAAFDSERFDFTRMLASRINERLGEVIFPLVYYRVTTPEHIPAPGGHLFELAQGPHVFGDDGRIESWITGAAAVAQNADTPKELWSWIVDLYRRAVGSERYQTTLQAHPEMSPGDDKLRREMVAGFNDHLAPFRQNRRTQAGNPDSLEELLRTGAERVRAEFGETVMLLRDRVGLGFYRRRGLTGGP